MSNHRTTFGKLESTAERALREVRQIIRDALGESDVTIYLFGSWARGAATPLSDIDVAVEPHRPLPRGALARARERLEESCVPYRVEVVDLSEADPAFRQRVLEEGVRWSG